MDDFEKSVPLYFAVSKVPKKDIETNILILRYREEGLSHEEIYEKLQNEHGIKELAQGGGDEIRTHEILRFVGLVNRCTRPLCDSSIY